MRAVFRISSLTASESGHSTTTCLGGFKLDSHGREISWVLGIPSQRSLGTPFRTTSHHEPCPSMLCFGSDMGRCVFLLEANLLHQVPV